MEGLLAACWKLGHEPGSKLLLRAACRGFNGILLKGILGYIGLMTMAQKGVSTSRRLLRTDPKVQALRFRGPSLRRDLPYPTPSFLVRLPDKHCWRSGVLKTGPRTVVVAHL